jgi:acyl-CoA oxidase
MIFQHLLTTLESALVDLLSFNLLSTRSMGADSTRILRKTIQELYFKLLPESIGLTDAFGFSDWELDR